MSSEKPNTKVKEHKREDSFSFLNPSTGNGWSQRLRPAVLRASRKANEVHARLSHIQPDLWLKLPKDLRDLNIQWRKKENEEKAKIVEQNKQITANLTEAEQEEEDVKE